MHLRRQLAQFVRHGARELVVAKIYVFKGH
jgi:hypothetical protein